MRRNNIPSCFQNPVFISPFLEDTSQPHVQPQPLWTGRCEGQRRAAIRVPPRLFLRNAGSVRTPRPIAVGGAGGPGGWAQVPGSRGERPREDGCFRLRTRLSLRGGQRGWAPGGGWARLAGGRWPDCGRPGRCVLSTVTFTWTGLAALTRCPPRLREPEAGEDLMDRPPRTPRPSRAGPRKSNRREDRALPARSHRETRAATRNPGADRQPGD